MNFLKKMKFFVFAAFALSLTGCLDIEEEVTYHDNGNGSYSMKMDMSQMKGMMDMMKNMGGETGAPKEETDGVVSDMEPETPSDVVKVEEVPADETGLGGAGDLGKMGEEFSKSLEGIKTMKGVKNAVALNDTANLIFGYSFEFDNVETLNKAIVALNKDKFEGKNGPTFVAGKKSFERTSAFDLGQLIAQAMSENEEGAESMDMIKMFFGEMKYKQIYHFDRKVKKSDNAEAEISADGKTVTLTANPFAEGAKTKSVANVLKLK